MKSVSLSGSRRGNVGKKDAATLRRSGLVPGVIYGGKEQVHFQVSELELTKLIYSPDAYEIQFDLEGTTYRCVMQEVQFHPVSDRPVHVDFLQLFEDKEVRVNLPVRTVGASPGVMNGGRLAINYRKLPVRGLPSALPDAVELSIAKLKIGMDIRVRDISIPGCAILQPQSAVVVAVKATRASMSAAGGDDEEEESTEAAAPAEGGENAEG